MELPYWTDILAEDAARINYEELLRLRAEREAALRGKTWHTCRDLFSQLPDTSTQTLQPLVHRSQVDANGVVVISVDPWDPKVCVPLIRQLIPWRKGPFQLGECAIDAEWCSNKKWDRISRVVHEIEGQRVADVGCNNGYYMFRLAQNNPRKVIGFDPSERCWYQFQLFQHFAQDPRLQYELLGISEMLLFPDYFDLTLCMGVLSHHRSPLDLLNILKLSLAPGGTLVIENLAIPGDGPYALCVGDRYAQMRNVYSIPTRDGIVAWLEKAGFIDIEVIAFDKTDPLEQRQTALAPYQSLSDYLDPLDDSKTVEGWPAPHRVVVRSRRKPKRTRK